MSRQRPHKKNYKIYPPPPKKVATFDIRYMALDMQRSMCGPADFYCHSTKLP
jgi:hypothetical protein